MEAEIVKQFMHNGKKCIIRRMSASLVGVYYTGYVGIPEDHKFHGMFYDEVMNQLQTPEELTFSGTLQDEGEGTWFIGWDSYHPHSEHYDEQTSVEQTKKLAECF